MTGAGLITIGGDRTVVDPNAISALASRLRGTVLRPGGTDYEAARKVWNGAVDQRPGLIVRCAGVEDVVQAVAFGRQHDLLTSVRAGGHNIAGKAVCGGGLMIDLAAMRGIEVDPVARLARVEGGALLGDLDQAAQAYGLATTAGVVTHTGVAGLTLGGGVGRLARKHGLACDNLLAAELVTADGRIVRATAEENTELLWALRGGGGAFGVVTALEVALHPLPEQVWAGLALFAVDRAREVVRAFRDLMNAAPDELSLACAFVTAPEEDDIPEPLRGKQAVALLGMWAGDPAAGERALAPVRALEPDADFFAPTGYAEFQCSVDDPPGHRNYWSAENVVDLPDAAIDALVDRARELPAGPAQLFVVAWGGQVARVGSDHSPLAGRTSGFIVHPLLLWDDPADDERMRALAHDFCSDVSAWSTGATYPNFLGAEAADRMEAAFGDVARRLAEVKATWDPHGVFRTHQRIEELGS